MTRDEATDAVVIVLAEVTGMSHTRLLSASGDGGLPIDSLNAVEAAVALETKFGIDLGHSEQTALALTQLNSFVDLVYEVANSGAGEDV
jgi:acyl carrier protein